MFLVGNCNTLSLSNGCGNYDAYYNCISAGIKIIRWSINCELFTPGLSNTLKAGKPRTIRTIGWITNNSIQTSGIRVGLEQAVNL